MRQRGIKEGQSTMKCRRKRWDFLLVLLAVMAILPFPAYAAWDGYSEVDQIDMRVNLLNMNSPFDVIDSGGRLSQTHTQNGNKYCVEWDMATQNLISMAEVPQDWSDYDHVEITYYAEGATGNQFMLLVDNGTVNGEWSYYRKNTTVESDGWKTVIFYLDEMSVSRNPSWQAVTSAELWCSGWNMNSDGCTGKIYLSEIMLVRDDGSVMYDLIREYGTETVQKAVAALESGAAVYAGSAWTVTSGGTVEALDPGHNELETVYSQDTALVPVGFFDSHLGTKSSLDGERYTIGLNDKQISGTVGQTAYTLPNGTEGSLPQAPRMIDDVLYLPVAGMAEALGLNAVQDGRLAAVSSSDAISALERPSGVNELNEIIACLAVPATVVEEITDADLDQVKDNWLRSLIGSAEENDMSDPYIAAKVNAIAETGKKTWESMSPRGTKDKLFTADKNTASADMTATAGRIYDMALAYGTPGSVLYHNEVLRDDLIYALDWFEENRYGHNEMEGQGWRDANSFNWWDWDIGTPAKLVPTLIIMEEDLLSQGRSISKYLALYDQRNPTTERTGSNAFNIGQITIGSALLQHDAERILRVQDMLKPTFQYVDNGRSKGEGFYTDGSYIFHTKNPLNGQYGAEHLALVGPYLSMFAGTRLEIRYPMADNLADWIYNAFDKLIYQGKMFRMVEGRSPAGGIASAREVLGSILDSMASLDAEDQQKMKAIVKEYIASEEQSAFYENLSLCQVLELTKIMKDDNVTVRPFQQFNHVYHNADKVVHQRGNFAIGISMSSSRIANYESINGRNLTGWYVSDGMTEYWVKDNYTQQPADYWNGVNPYRLPGTTVDTQERPAVSISSGNEYLSGQDFVGAVSLEDTWGTAAMQLESYHSEGGTGSTSEIGGPLPAHDSSLMAKKAWFMFDDEVVALGTDISANDDAEVLTVVDNKRSVETMQVSQVQESTPYGIVAVEASEEPQPENPAEATLDEDYTTRWASETGATITWDLGEVKELGFMALAFMNGASRTQRFILEYSEDGQNWIQTYEGNSSGMTEMEEFFSLEEGQGRYVRFTNLGNSNNSWVSLSEAKIYPSNEDGSIGVQKADIIGTDRFVADGQDITLTAGDTSLKDTKWAWFQQSGGYYFPQSGDLFARYTNSAQSFMELWFSHGVNPTDATYAYTLLPGKTPEETAAYAASPDIQVKVNTAELQVVEETTLKATGMVFWEAGSYSGVTVSQPMIVMLRETDNGLILAASDPTHKLTEGTVTLNQPLSSVESDLMTTVAQNGQNTTIHYNFTGSAGRTMEVYMAYS